MKIAGKVLVIALALVILLCAYAVTASANSTADTAPEGDTVNLTVDYNDGRGAVTETYEKGTVVTLDTSKLPDTLVFYDTRLGQKSTLMLNGEPLTDLSVLADPITLDSDKTYIFSGELIESYGWMIMTNDGKIINSVTDIGNHPEDLIKRINEIERDSIFDPLKNDVGGTLAPDDPKALTYAYSHTTDGYTVRLFDDFEFSETLTFFNHAPNKVVNIDLNGNSISTAQGSFASVFGMLQFWEVNSDGAAVKIHGSTTDGKNGSYNSSMLNPTNTIVTVYNKNQDIKVNVISSKAGATLTVDSNSAPLSAAYQSTTKIGGKNYSGYPDVYITLGNPTDSTAIGPDENLITVKAKYLINATAF